MSRWVLSADFGRQSDRTALAAIEVVPWLDIAKPFLDVRYLHRLPVGMPYPEQCSFIGALCSETPELATADVIVDATGVGVAVADSLREVLGRSFTELTITGGRTVKADGRKLSVPKKDLISRLAVAMQSRRLRVSQGLPEAVDLYKELGAFSVTISESGQDSYGARSGAHDDLVLAVSYGIWKAEVGGQSSAFLEYGRQRGMVGNRPRVASPIFAPPPEPEPEPDAPVLTDAERLMATRNAVVRYWGRR